MWNSSVAAANHEVEEGLLVPMVALPVPHADAAVNTSATAHVVQLVVNGPTNTLVALDGSTNDTQSAAGRGIALSSDRQSENCLWRRPRG